MTTFQIVLDNATNVYFGGQSVTGNVVLVLKESMKMRKIRLLCRGEANVHWTTGSGEKKRYHHISDNYYDHKVILVGKEDSDSDLALSLGSYQFPFNFIIPPNAPTSFEGDSGYVRHILTATIDRPRQIDNECYAAFTVINPLDLNMEPPEFRKPYETENEINVSCCFTSGAVLARFGINKRCFVPGETILCSYSVQNRTNKTMKHTSMSLQQRVEYKHHRDLTGPITRTTTVGKAVNNTPIPSGQSKEWNNVAIAIPAVAPSRLDGCEIINVIYLVEFNTSLGGSMEAEVVIGTIPLSGSDTSSMVMAQSMSQTWQSFDTSTTGPSQLRVITSPSGQKVTYAPRFNGPVVIKGGILDNVVTEWAPFYPMYGQTT